MNRLLSSFERWLLAPQSGRGLSYFRIGWALAMFVASAHELSRIPAYATHRYHIPIWDCLAPTLEPGGLRKLIGCALVASLLVALGLLTRLSLLVVVGVHGWLFAGDLLLFRNHIYLGLLTGVLLCASPCSAFFALDAWLCKHASKSSRSPGEARSLRLGSLIRHALRLSACGCTGNPESRALPAVQLIKAQVAIVYLAAALNKLRGSFLDGFTLQEELPFVLRDGLLAPLAFQPNGRLAAGVANLLESRAWLSACAISITLVELFLALGLPSPRLRRYAVWIGVAMHASIWLLMNVLTFGLLMVASYPLFVGTATAPAFDHHKPIDPKRP